MSSTYRLIVNGERSPVLLDDPAAVLAVAGFLKSYGDTVVVEVVSTDTVLA